jgi:hypothetical protein
MNIILNINKTKPNTIGKKIFQHNRINWSTRYLGNEALTQIKKNKINEVLSPNTNGSITNNQEHGIDNQPPKNIKTVNKLIAIIDPYSAKKNKANPMLEYSTLKPETSSDSASGKSNGARFVSAKIETKNIKNKGKKGITKKIYD